MENESESENDSDLSRNLGKAILDELVQSRGITLSKCSYININLAKLLSETQQELARNVRFIMAEQVEIKNELRKVRGEISGQKATVTFNQCSTVREIGQLEQRLRSSTALTDALVNLKTLKIKYHI